MVYSALKVLLSLQNGTAYMNVFIAMIVVDDLLYVGLGGMGVPDA